MSAFGAIRIITALAVSLTGCGAPPSPSLEEDAAPPAAALIPAQDTTPSPSVPQDTLVASEEGPPESPPTLAEAADEVEDTAPPTHPELRIFPPIEMPDVRPTFARPEHVRGIYLNAWAAGSFRRSEELIELARRTEINTFVIDIKDASGFVSYSSAVPLARESQAVGQLRIRDISGLLERLSAAGIYPIARIVVIKDPILTAYRPDLAVQDSAGALWSDGKAAVWANPYKREVWDYHLRLAREAVELGFPEIQWDYVRFPDAPLSRRELAVYEGAEDQPMELAIRDFLIEAREEFLDDDVRMTADVFGVTTSARNDVGIGQLWEAFIDVVDVALPMVYPSHYWRGSFGFDHPNSFPYEVVRAALEDGLARSAAVPGAGSVRPWLQAFSLGDPPYGPAEIRAQIEATYDAGVREWILWNPGSRYPEDALEPVAGFPEGFEPMLRVGGTLVRRGEHLKALITVEELVLPAASLADSVGADSLTRSEAADTGLIKPDTMPGAPRR